MKKTLLLVLTALLVIATLVSCGGKAETPDAQTGETTKKPVVKTEESTTETSANDSPYTNHVPTQLAKDLSEYDFVHTFKAPEGNPRDIVYDYMLKMAKIEWVAGKTWTTTWKEKGDFTVNLTYEEGKTYYGVPYARTNGPLCEFEQFVPENKVFVPNSEYYEEIVGNHCSSSMVMAYQQIIDLTYSGALKPLVSRTGLIMFPEGLEIPPARTDAGNPDNPDNWISETMFAHNGKEAVYEGYAKLDKGDILYKNIDGSGHTRMVHKVEIFKSATGKLMPNRSFVYCLEQTNAWWDSKKDTTWWIDKKYSFDKLFDEFFMPVTFCIFHEENPVITDAHVTMTGKNTPDSIQKSLKGTIESNYPLTYAYITIRDTNGQIVSQSLRYILNKQHKLNLRNLHGELNLNSLPAGKYTYNLRAGIARGGVDVETFEFTIG